MINWHLEKRKLTDLKPHSKNPRKISQLDAEQLRKSLEKFGIIDKPIVTPGGHIIGGHQRVNLLKGMKGKKQTEIECWVPDQELTQEDIDELCIRLNRNTGEWDFDILKDWDINSLIDWGFSAEELTMGMETIDVIPTEEPDNELLEPPKTPRSVLGDIYDLGDHRIICGDSTSPSVVETLLMGANPILMITDPPYGVEYDPTWRKKHNKRKDGTNHTASGAVQNDDQVNWSLAWHLFPGSVAYVWHGGKHCAEVQKSLEEAEFETIAQIIWVKQHFALSRGDYHWQHEPAWYAVRKGHNHNWQGARNQSTVWEIANLNAFGKNQEDERTAHSTQKPLDCMSRPIKNNSMIGDGIYDPFLGSGTTLLACEHLQRKCFGIELDPAYCDIIVDRWVKYRKKIGRDCTVMLNNQTIEWESYGRES